MTIHKKSKAIKNSIAEKNAKVKKAEIKKSVAKKPEDKKPVAKKPEVKKLVAKKPVVKKPVAKKPVAKKPEVKKLVAKKPVAKKAVAKKAVAKKAEVAKKTIKSKLFAVPTVNDFTKLFSEFLISHQALITSYVQKMDSKKSQVEQIASVIAGIATDNKVLLNKKGLISIMKDLLTLASTVEKNGKSQNSKIVKKAAISPSKKKASK
ncbi:MAG: histone H1-like repetitive region-containing protein [Alphaproteobacteria bacterium]